jgi:peroxiredoxin
LCCGWLLAGCGLCSERDQSKTSDPSKTIALEAPVQSNTATPKPTTDETRKEVRLTVLNTVQSLPGRDFRSAQLVSGRERPWVDRFGEDYIAFTDALVTRGQFFACSSVDGLVSGKLGRNGELGEIQHLGPDHPSFKRFPGGGKSSRCGRLAKGHGFLYAVHRGDSFLSPSYLALYAINQPLPRLVHVEFPKKGTFSSVAVGPHRVFVGMEGYGVHVFDKTGGRLRSRGMIPGVSHASDVLFWGGRLYIASGNDGLKVVDVSNHAEESLLSTLSVEASVLGLAMHKWSTTLYLLTGSKGFAAVDVRAPKEPKLVSWTQTQGHVIRASVESKYMAVADFESVRIFDLQSPHKPKLRARRRVPSGPHGALTFAVATAGSFVYAASWYGLEAFRFDPVQKAACVEFDARTVEVLEKPQGFSAKVGLRNCGDDILRVTPQSSTNESITLPPEITVPPGEAATLTFEGSSPFEGRSEAQVKVRTNDPHESIVTLRLTPKPPRQSNADWSDTALFQRSNGTDFRLDSLRGKVIVLAYFATFCPPCFMEFPELERHLWLPLKDRGVQVYGVSGITDDAASVARFKKQTKVSFELLSTKRRLPLKFAPNNSMVTYYPFHMVIDAKGHIRYAGSSLDIKTLKQKVLDALEPKVSPKPAK